MKKLFVIFVVCALLFAERAIAQNKPKETEKLQALSKRLKIDAIGKCVNLESDSGNKLIPGGPQYLPCFVLKDPEKDAVKFLYYIGIFRGAVEVIYVLKLMDGVEVEIIYNSFLDAWERGLFKKPPPAENENNEDKISEGHKVGPF